MTLRMDCKPTSRRGEWCCGFGFDRCGAEYNLSVRNTILIIAIVIPLCAPIVGQDAQPRRNPCKTPENRASCVWVHGRLRYGSGTPAVRLWKIGTHHVFGILSGPRTSDDLDNEHPELPANVADKLQPFKNQVFGDFEICPLEPEKPGSMQSACIDQGKNIIVDE